MKKLLAIMLCLVMLSSLTAVAFAQEEVSFDTEAAGFRFRLPGEFGNAKGIFALAGCNEVGGLYPDVYLTEFFYVGLPEDTFRELDKQAYAEDITDEELEALYEEMDQYMLYPLTVATAGTRELEEAFYNNCMISEDVEPKRVLIAEKDGYVYYLYDYSDINEANLLNATEILLGSDGHSAVDPALYWRDRSGTADQHTSFSVGYNILLAAQMLGKSIDYHLVWNMGHGSNEGTSTGTFIDWINEICA